MGTNFNSGTSNLSPGRFRRQKLAVSQRSRQVYYIFERRRQEREEQERKIAFDQACLNTCRRQIKQALGFTLTEADDVTWPDSPWLTPKTFDQSYIDEAMQYFDPSMTEAQFMREFTEIGQFWQLEYWIKARVFLCRMLTRGSKWFDITGSDCCQPLLDAEAFFFDPAQVEMKGTWKHWKLKSIKKQLEESLESVKNFKLSGQDLLAMADKNQGYVHGEMWWNAPGRWLRKLFNRRK